jgi:hypothetical protein
MIRGGVFPAFGQAMRDRLQANVMAFLAVVQAFVHLTAHPGMNIVRHTTETPPGV